MKQFWTLLLTLILFAVVAEAQPNCPAIPGTSHSNAPLINCGLDGFFGTLPPQGQGGFENPPGWLANCGTVENGQWIAFIASFAQATFNLEVENCAFGQGMQGSIYGIDNNSCDLFALYEVTPCYSGGNGPIDFSLTFSNFIQGEVYYLFLDGFNGDMCDYTLTLSNVVPFPSPDPPTLVGPSPVAAGSTHGYSLEFPNLPDIENPCNNMVQDDCICPPCEFGYVVPTSITWTGPPGASIVQTGFYSADVTFGEESGEICITLDGECGSVTYCLYVEVIPSCFNNPAPPGDTCMNAPLFCADALEGFCSSNEGLTADTSNNINSLLNCSVENNAWIRISPCEESISLSITVDDCLQGIGLEVALLLTEDCDTFTLLQNCETINNGTTGTLNYAGLTPGETYHLMIDGITGDECDFSINILSGIYPNDPNPNPDTLEYVITEISPAMIDGPAYACFGEPATFTYIPPVCIIEEGDCGGGTPPNGGNPNGSSCPMPEESCQTPWLIKVDTFLVWHLPDGAIFIGDSTGYTVDVLFDPFAGQGCIDTTYSDSLFSVNADSCLSQNFPMIPTDSSGVISDTIFQEVWVELGCTFMLPDSSLVNWIPSQNNGIIPDSFYWSDPATENVFCPCDAAQAICGFCNYTAYGGSGVIIDYCYDNIVTCEDDCFDFCGASLCDGGQFWCRKDCGFKIVNLTIDEPEIFDLGWFELCPWDCFFLNANGQSYCNPGDYDVIVIDPISGCEDHYLFRLEELPFEWVSIENLTIECTPDDNFYTVSFDLDGFGPFFVNNEFINGNSYTSAPIASGDSYSFWAESFGPCPEFDQISGSHTCCTPQTYDLGNISLCEGECFTLPENGEDYCAPGNYDILVARPSGCEDHYIFVIDQLPNDIVTLSNPTFICSTDNTTYSVSFDISGTGTPFYVNGDSFNGGTYTLSGILSGDPYSFVVESSGACPTTESLSGDFTCAPCVPQTNDLGVIELCPGDCFTLPENGTDYCVAGSYSIDVLNNAGCTDVFNFQIIELNNEVVSISNPSTFCVPDNSAYIVTFEISGNPPFLINGVLNNSSAYTSAPIPSGDPYSFTVESTSTCFIGDNISGDFTCPPCSPQTIELGTIELCPNECFNLDNVDYCQAGEYNIEIMNSDGCLDTHHFFINLNQSSVPTTSNLTELCDVTFTSYTVSFTIQGVGPFLVNGNFLPGNDNFFQSSPIPSGSSYLFEVEHSGPCAEPIIIAGTFSCQAACSIAAGTLSDTPDYLCQTQSIKVNHNNNSILESDDILEFILFLGADPIVGQIYDRNETGIFPFNPTSMTLGNPYQVVAVAGNRVNGEADLQDNCLDISNQISITYYDLPQILTSQADDSLILTCMDPEVILASTVAGGSGQISMEWSGNGLISDSSSLATQVPGLFYFTATDVITGCTANDSVLVLENKVFPIINFDPAPSLDCATDQVLINASNSEQGPPFEYTWFTNNGHFTETPSSLTPEVDAPGIYTLQIINTESGCVSEDQIEVLDLEDDLKFVELYVEDALCRDTKDASIEIINIEGGNPGYEFIFNGFKFDDQSIFENLSAGEYELQITDSKGCTLDTIVSVTQPDEMNIGVNDNYFVSLGASLDILLDPNFVPGTISWQHQNGNILSDSIRLLSIPTRSGFVDIEITDENGCTMTQQIFVRVGEPDDIVFVPNAFSPNGDLNNDFLTIFPNESVKTIHSFSIFSRWGDLVHNCQNISAVNTPNGICPWNGQLKGKDLDPAVFVYILEIELIDGEKRTLTGDITLVR